MVQIPKPQQTENNGVSVISNSDLYQCTLTHIKGMYGYVLFVSLNKQFNHKSVLFTFLSFDIDM